MKFQVVLLVLCSVIIVSQIGVNAEKKLKHSKGAKAPVVHPEKKDKKFGLLGSILVASAGLGIGAGFSNEIKNLGSYITNATGNFVKGVEALFCNLKFYATFTTCCKPGPGPLANLTELQPIAAACKSNPQVFKIFADYTLKDFSGLGTPDGFLKLKSIITAKAFGPPACFADCMFKKQGLISDAGVIDYDLVAANLSKAVPDVWKDSVIAATAGCKDAVEAASVKTITVPGYSAPCSTKPALLLQCVRKTVYTSCPEQSKVNTTSCINDLAKLEKCPDFSLPFQ